MSFFSPDLKKIKNLLPQISIQGEILREAKAFIVEGKFQWEM